MELTEQLKNAKKNLMMDKTLESTNKKVIGIGSKFRATIDFKEVGETCNYFISDSDVRVSGYMTIPSKAPLALAVVGLSTNDKFSYDVNNHIYTGTVDEVYIEDVIEKPKTMKLEK